MNPNQVDKIFLIGNADKPYIDLIPCATYDKNARYSSSQTFEKIEALPDEKKSEVYQDVFNKLKEVSKTNADKLKKLYTDQSKYYNESTLTEMLLFLQKNMTDVKFPFDKFTHIPNEEKARRQSVQKRAFDLYLNRQTEDSACLRYNAVFGSVDTIHRSVQKFFRPERLTEEECKKAEDLMRLWKRVSTASSSHKEGEPFTEQELKDRKEMAKAIEDKLTAALNGAFEVAAAKNDEEFMAAIDKHYQVGMLLTESANSDFNNLIEASGLTENDLSPEFVKFYKANFGMCVSLGSAIQSRLSVIANPLYPEIEPEEMLQFNYLLDAELDNHSYVENDLQAIFKKKFSKPGITVPSSDEPNEFNYFKGYALAAGFTCGDDYIKKSAIPVLSSYAHKYLGISDYKECNVVDENGILIQDKDVLENKLLKGESVNLLMKDARYMVPIKLDKWGSPVPTQTERSPFFQKIENSKKGLLLMNKKLPDELKMKFGDDSEKTEEEKLDEKFEKNFLDPEKVRLHIRAKALIKEVGMQGSTNKTDKGGVIKDGRAINELGRLQEKFGKVPEEKAYFNRTFSYFLKTDGSEEAQKYNESLYKSYLAGTDDAKKIIEHEIKKILALDIKEIRDASETYEGAVDYYEKHFNEVRIAFDIANLSLSNVFTSGFKNFATANATKFQALNNVQAKVFFASETAFMADAFDEAVYGNIDANNYLYNFVTETNGRTPDGNVIGQPEYSVFLEKYRFDLEQAELQKLPNDARTFPENGFVNDKPVVETTGKEYTRDDEYKLLFQREICEKGINGKTYSSLTDFLAQNKGSFFNVQFGRDSKEYKALSNFLEEFQDRLAGKKEAFPEQRQNNPKMIKQDYEYLKKLFENYIKHKRDQLLNDKKTSFKLNSTDDKRYKFALKMCDILKQVAEFRPLNLESKCERNYGIKTVGKIVNNTADGGFGKNIVNEESKFVLNDKGKNIVNEESKLVLNDGMTEIDTDLLQSKLGDYFKTVEKNQMSETPAVQTVETVKQINGEDLNSKGI